MKKFYTLLIALLAVCGLAQAQTVTFTPGSESSGADGTGAQSMTKDGVTVAISGGTLTRDDNYRIYKNQTLTVSSESGAIVSIQFTCTESDAKQYGPGCFTTEEGYSYQGKVGTWTGNATEVVFTASSNQVRATEIVVTLGNSDPNYVAKPTITPATGTYYSAQEVTITAGEGATIYYTTDGSEPTASSKAYTAPFTVSETTTVKAIAVKGENKSEVVESVITIEKMTAKTIAEIIAAGNADQATTAGTVYGAYAMGFLLGDNTGYLFVYGSNTVSVGAQLVVTGKVSQYGGCYQISNATIDETGSTSVTYPTPKEITGADLDALVAAPAVTFVKVKGKLTSTGNYKNFTVEGATVTGSILASDAVFGNTEVGDDIEVTGYFVYQSGSGKYGNILATEVKVTGSTVVEVPEYSKLAEVKAAATKDQVKVKLNLTDVLVSYATNNNVYLYDGTDGLLIYGSNSAELKTGDKISGSVEGMLYLYNGLTEIASPTYTVNVTSSDNAVPVQEVAADVLAANKKDYESELVIVKGLVPNAATWDSNRKVACEWSDDNDNVSSVVIRDNWKIATEFEFDTDAAYTVTGFVAIFNEDPVQVYPRTLEDIVKETDNSVHSLNADGRSDSAIYTLAGQRVSKAVRGLYIVGSKKVFVK